MPSTIYLRSGDEFTVSQPYAVALERWTARSAEGWFAEFTAVWWRDPRFSDEDDARPLYVESPVTLDLDGILAVERVAGPELDGLERARRAEAERADHS